MVAGSHVNNKTLIVGPSFSGETYDEKTEKHFWSRIFITTRSPEQCNDKFNIEEIKEVGENEAVFQRLMIW